VTGSSDSPREVMPAWRLAWPCWAFLLLVILAAVQLLPGGYARAVVAAPVLLMVPGSLTLRAIWSSGRCPQGAMFICYAALLSVAWLAFASLGLYVLGVLITPKSTYCCILAVSAVLAVVAQARILLGQPGSGRRAARESDSAYPDLHDAEIGTPAISPAMGARYYAAAAVIAGLGLLVGGAYAIEHVPHPAPTGFTWIAWAAPITKGDVSIGSSGARLPFQIRHQQSDTAGFKLEAEWIGNPSRPLAKPLSLTVGPNQTLRGDLFVPPLPNGCTYRLVVTLTAVHETDQFTKQAQTWSIDADVRDPSKSSKACAS
jgi:hypothetical protein